MFSKQKSKQLPGSGKYEPKTSTKKEKNLEYNKQCMLSYQHKINRVVHDLPKQQVQY